jgi:FkbM family methyltransferase
MLSLANDMLERLTGRRLRKPPPDPEIDFFTRLHLLHPRVDAARWHTSLDDRFVRHVCEQFGRGQAQFFQDWWVLFELGGLRGGYFVEFGATDGETLSNTCILEREYNWTGILAEPNPATFALMRHARTAVADPRCVHVRTGEQVKFHVADNADLSTIAAYTASDSHAEARREPAGVVSVETVSLDDLLDQHGAPGTIDFLSIDTEGSEFDILSAFSFSRHVRCLTVEHNHAPRRLDIDALLKSRGYIQRFPYASSVDGWYIHQRDVREM